ncbi:putative protein with phoX homologous domain, present in p47phox and p40phox [Lyophyllum shimeji]|uniref:Uncharacterized protein n=1 Tax=Lyophyllum shimeji TaxID=47721 RepID=A0A9P3UKA9_LYOSH|nr:putative protein with phoX homologous domain, present in p47phox and p40phox [Lyophyllum shimeji]
MVWLFTSTRTVSFRKSIHASPEAVLRVLHDPKLLFAVNPLITDVAPDPSDPRSYVVTDRLVFLGCIRTQTKYKARLDIRDDGMDTQTVAGLGTKLRGQYRVRAGEDGTTELSEDTSIEGLSLLMPYIVKTMSEAHESILENLAARAENRSSRRLTQPNPETGSSAFRWLSLATVALAAFLLRYLYTDSFGIFIYMAFAGVLSVVWSKTANDPYGLFHLTLNKLPAEDDSIPPKTEWLNMGFWRHTDVFPEACAALAIKLIQAAQCKAGDRILDVGHGTGESIILLLSGPSVPRPSTITGITSLPAHHLRSRKRVDRLLSSLRDPRPEVYLHLGDAVCQGTVVGHPLEPSSKTLFDRILALDCAYHFNTRNAFLRQALRKLAPGGRIALADIYFDPRLVQSRRAWLISSLFKLMPKRNMVSIDGYVAEMEEMGYVDVQVEDITQDVFPGFVHFLNGRGFGWKVFGYIIECCSQLDQDQRIGGFFPECQSMTAVQAVYIRGYEERTTPKPHTVYRIEIQAHVRSWQMWRRYSEFDDLHTELTKSVGTPPASLPPKHRFSLRPTDTKILEARRTGLENYLRAIISAKDDKWRESFAFKDFLGVPISRQGGPAPTQFTSSTWLDEHIELQTRLRAVRADINKRDALSDRGDVAASHQANVSAKAKLAGLSARIATLEKGLEGLAMSGISEGELQRRSDMVARLRDDHEKLTRMVTVARQASRSPSGQSGAASPASETDREALLGTSAAKPVTRVFGAKQPPKETDQTRPLDDHGLLGLQQLQMQEQDQQLAQITTILQRQKQLGIAIGNEVGSQIELLDDLSNNVDRVGGKLAATNRQMNRLG